MSINWDDYITNVNVALAKEEGEELEPLEEDELVEDEEEIDTIDVESEEVVDT